MLCPAFQVTHPARGRQPILGVRRESASVSGQDEVTSYFYHHMKQPIRKAERQRIDAFEQWCGRRLLRVPWTARRSILKEISPGCSLEGLMLKLRLLM